MNAVSARITLARSLRRAVAPLVLASVPQLVVAQQPAPGTAQSAIATVGRALSLDDAIRLAARESEELDVARAGVARAGGQTKQARSLYLPQLNGSLAYARTLR